MLLKRCAADEGQQKNGRVWKGRGKQQPVVLEKNRGMGGEERDGRKKKRGKGAAG